MDSSEPYLFTMHLICTLLRFQKQEREDQGGSQMASDLSAPNSRIAVRQRFLPQTRVSQIIPQRGPLLPIIFAEEIVVRERFLRRGNRASTGLVLGSGKNRRRSRRESRDFGALSEVLTWKKARQHIGFDIDVSDSFPRRRRIWNATLELVLLEREWAVRQTPLRCPIWNLRLRKLKSLLPSWWPASGKLAFTVLTHGTSHSPRIPKTLK